MTFLLSSISYLSFSSSYENKMTHFLLPSWIIARISFSFFPILRKVCVAARRDANEELAASSIFLSTASLVTQFQKHQQDHFFCGTKPDRTFRNMSSSNFDQRDRDDIASFDSLYFPLSDLISVGNLFYRKDAVSLEQCCRCHWQQCRLLENCNNDAVLRSSNMKK